MDFPTYINNKEIFSSEKISLLSPINLQEVCKIQAMSKVQIEEAVNLSNNAFLS
jgi:hypothetical protein